MKKERMIDLCTVKNKIKMFLQTGKAGDGCATSNGRDTENRAFSLAEDLKMTLENEEVGLRKRILNIILPETRLFLQNWINEEKKVGIIRGDEPPLTCIFYVVHVYICRPLHVCPLSLSRVRFLFSVFLSWSSLLLPGGAIWKKFVW